MKTAGYFYLNDKGRIFYKSSLEFLENEKDFKPEDYFKPPYCLGFFAVPASPPSESWEECKAVLFSNFLMLYEKSPNKELTKMVLSVISPTFVSEILDKPKGEEE